MPPIRFLILNLGSGAPRKMRNLDLRLGGRRYMEHQRFIFSIFLENKERKKTEVTLGLILRFNLRLRVLHMEREYFAHHI
jgi:hypothetical protein